jgi:hypothetical protein
MGGGLPRTSRRLFVHEQRRLREARLDRSVQELDERRDSPEDLQQLAIEARARRQRRLVLAGPEELLELQVMRGRMILRVSERYARQSIAGELAN